MNCIYQETCSHIHQNLTGGCSNSSWCSDFHSEFETSSNTISSEIKVRITNQKCVKFVRSLHDFKSVEVQLNDYLESHPNLHVRTMSYATNFESALKLVEILVVVFEEDAL